MGLLDSLLGGGLKCALGQAEAAAMPALISAALVKTNLALQLHFLKVSESMGNHDSKVVDAGSVD